MGNNITSLIPKKKKYHKRMDIITINIPESYFECMKSMVENGQFTNRSQIAREALKDFLQKEKDFTVDLEIENFNRIKGFE